MEMGSAAEDPYPVAITGRHKPVMAVDPATPKMLAMTAPALSLYGELEPTTLVGGASATMAMLPHQRDVVMFLLKHLLCGTIGGMVFGGLLLWFDIAGLATLIFASPDRVLFLIMLFFGMFITFGSIAMAVGVMQLGEERD